jgi:rhodanese-related sulfurtransferase
MFWWVPFGQVPEIDARTLATLGDGEAPPQILDVRTRWEWRRSRIPNARRVNLASLRKRIPELGLDRGRPVVAVCLSAHRSIAAVRVLKSLGFSDTCQLKGGMKAWWRAGLPTEGSGSRLRHPLLDGGGPLSKAPSLRKR